MSEKPRGSMADGALLRPFIGELHWSKEPRANLHLYWVEKNYGKLKKQDLF